MENNHAHSYKETVKTEGALVYAYADSPFLYANIFWEYFGELLNKLSSCIHFKQHLHGHLCQ